MAAIRLTRTHRILVGIVVSGAVIIAGIGFAGSYAAVRTLALHKGFGWFANVFPIGVDAGIVVLLALDLLLTWLRIPFPLLRQTAWLLTAATIAFNGAAAWPDGLGVGMHAIIPVLFVVSVEAARHAIGRIADITADKHMESVRITRWLLAPLPTFRLWRRMKLWELRSYEETIRREQDRLVYRARLRARYGIAWRRKAPVEAIMPLRLAKYGVPLAETADAGLQAAGIEIATPVRQLEAAPAAAQETAAAESADASATATDTAPGAAATAQQGQQGAQGQQGQSAAQGVPGQAQLTPEQLFAAQQYAQQQAYEQQLYEQGYYGPFEGTPHDSPWFNAQQVQQAYYEGQQPYGPQGYEQAAMQAQAQAQAQYAQAQAQVMAPVGPYQERPLGYGALNGNGVPNGVHGANGMAGVNGVNGAGGNDAGNGVNGRTVPGPRREQQPEPAGEQPAPAPEPAPAPGPEADLETFPLAGMELPEDVSAEDAYFAAYRNYVQEHGAMPNARQLARYLPSVYKGTPPEERQLVSAIRDLRYRYTSEANAESIP
ncbi:DUF2637 domain-containing protein [Actinacidiphila acidipaludis]|uniref:DUF2637 domain-containing protein n=1 Tax=Actinacidiphila acidipaludis TaxID=2873382 RepID=A0ABS7Q4V9_9ACTN|nr:DUF2637 domain-containing protein [Streptomyces acidipaludis]MBY8878197.1 DUF2637 domain-containing protein [Streptomyces acidipaludis]